MRNKSLRLCLSLHCIRICKLKLTIWLNNVLTETELTSSTRRCRLPWFSWMNISAVVLGVESVRLGSRPCHWRMTLGTRCWTFAITQKAFLIPEVPRLKFLLCVALFQVGLSQASVRLQASVWLTTFISSPSCYPPSSVLSVDLLRCMSYACVLSSSLICSFCLLALSVNIQCKLHFSFAIIAVDVWWLSPPGSLFIAKGPTVWLNLTTVPASASECRWPN